MSFIPSPQQARIFEWVREGTGSANVIAVAGAGKTTTLLEAVSLMKGYVFIGAYNKKIADELQHRLSSKPGVDMSRVRASTMHGAGFSAWRRVAPNVRVDGKKLLELADLTFKNISPSLKGAVVKLCSLGKQAGIGIADNGNIQDTGFWSDLAEHFDIASDLEENDSTEQLLTLARDLLLLSISKDKEVIDFDDMIYSPLYHNARFFLQDWVLLDEAQDTNFTRRLLAKRMLKPGGRLIAVGDPRQAIYGFTGADADSMDLIKRDFRCVELPLTVTYRCPKNVVNFAKQWVSHIEAHPSAPEGIVRSISFADFKKETLGDLDVILCRNTKPIVSLAYNLIKSGKACHVEGREIGKGLVTLVRKWKVKSLDDLTTRLATYRAREIRKAMEKKQETRVAAIEDKVDSLLAIIEGLQEEGKNTVQHLVDFINRLFDDTDVASGQKFLTLSTVHKSKGREWNKVYLLGRNSYMPSKYAHKDWQRLQEDNLIYVAATRAKQELVEVAV